LGQPFLNTARKTCFLRLIVCLTNIFELFNILRSKGQEYLLTYKISQAFFEMFFSTGGGWNNNPNAFQFQNAYTRLLLRHDSREFDNGNCLSDGIDILHVGSKRTSHRETIFNFEIPVMSVDSFDHDCRNTLWKLTPYVENIVLYISGFIARKILNMKICSLCEQRITVEPKDENNTHIKIKNREALLTLSLDVQKICLQSEKIFRQYSSEIFKIKNIEKFLINKVNGALGILFNNETMNNHVMSQDMIDSHRSLLQSLIIENYIKIRLCHESKIISQKDENVRHKYTKDKINLQAVENRAFVYLHRDG
jgi:hypothetical protein